MFVFIKIIFVVLIINNQGYGGGIRVASNSESLIINSIVNNNSALVRFILN